MKYIHSENAPAAVGPYSHAVRVGGMVFCSGQIPLDPATKALVPGGIREQTLQVLQNITAVLEAEGMSLANVAKTTVFLTDIKDFALVNGLYAEAFGAHKPARSALQVAALPLGAQIEIEVIAAD